MHRYGETRWGTTEVKHPKTMDAPMECPQRKTKSQRSMSVRPQCAYFTCECRFMGALIICVSVMHGLSHELC